MSYLRAIIFGLITAFLILLTAYNGFTGTPKSALGAIAMSADGSQLVVAGDNRVLYVLDTKTLEVTKRLWIKVNPIEMYFSKDGSVLVIEETDSSLYFYDTKTWELKSKTKESTAGKSAYAADADLLAAIKSSSKATTIKLFKISEAKEIASFEISEQLEAIAITPDGKNLFGISKSKKTDKEKRTKTPKEFKKLEKLKFEQQNDERMAKVIWFDATGDIKEEQETWYSSGSGTRLLMPTAETVYVINYQNKNAIIPKKGEISLFQLTTSYNYGIGISPDQTLVGTGGLRDGSVTNLADLTNGSTFKIDSLPSWPEYFKGFIVTKDGTAYGVTTAYRLAKVKPSGEIEKIAPVF